MHISLIGCGKVGTTIFYRLRKDNVIVGCYDINKTHQKRTSRLLRVTANLTLEQLCTKSNALFFATPDDSISDAYNTIKPFIQHKTYVYHFSGLLPSTVFPRSKHTYRASVHPFATFPYIAVPPLRKQYPVFVEGDAQALRAIYAIFPKKYFTIHKLTVKNKTMYHLAGVFSSNFLIGLMSATQDICKKFGWSTDEINEFVIPIMKETIAHARIAGVDKALSGPLERGDTEIVKKHLKALERHPSLFQVYTILTEYLASRPPRKNKTHKISELLKNL